MPAPSLGRAESIGAAAPPVRPAATIGADPRPGFTRWLDRWMADHHLAGDYTDNNLNPVFRVPLALRGMAGELAESKVGQAANVLSAVVPAVAALKVPVALRQAFAPAEIAAIEGTKGARLTPDGLAVQVFRAQTPDMPGAPTARTGTFYETSENILRRHYRSAGNPGFGGPQVLTGETLARNPLIVQASRGGPITEATLQALHPKAAARLPQPTRGQSFRDQIEATAELAYDMGLDGDRVFEAWDRARQFNHPSIAPSAQHGFPQSYGHKRGLYAAREALAALLGRAQGHDAIITRRGNRLGEFYDLREAVNPSPTGDFTVHPDHMWQPADRQAPQPPPAVQLNLPLKNAILR